MKDKNSQTEVEEPLTSQGVRLVDSIKKTAILVVCCLLLLTAMSNSLTWHFERFWGASHDFWQSKWGAVCDFFDYNVFIMASFGTFFVTNLVFWFVNSWLMALDISGKPKVLLKYKVQPEKNTPLRHEDLLSALKRVIFNQTVVGLPVMCAAGWMLMYRGCEIAPAKLPTFQWFLFEILIATLFEELGFYYSHRLMHHPRLYKHIHKIHHEWTAPIGIISLYAHPLEHVLSNLFPPFIGPMLMGSHIGVCWVWFCLALVSTSIAHSGFHFPFLPSPEAHDFHHLKFTNNFGVLGILDRLHGTDRMFRASKAYKRHFLLLSIVPVLEQFPEEKNLVTEAD